jgi:hypothetical protein
VGGSMVASICWNGLCNAIFRGFTTDVGLILCSWSSHRQICCAR